MSQVFPHTVFAVLDRPYCVWDYELSRHNLQFCEKLDPEWFVTSLNSHLAGTDVENPEELPQDVALAARLTFHHALETFFAVLFAAFQAPHAVPAWLELYRSEELRELVQRAAHGATILNAWGVPQATWENLSRRFNIGWPAEQDDGEATVMNFAKAWSSLAADFLDERTRAEYNGIKHGFRASPGGSALKVGLEAEPGVAAPPEAMQFVGGSHHGSSVFVVEPIPAGTKARKAVHLHLKTRNILWIAETTIQKVVLLAMSMNNILGATRILNGVEASKVRFDRFADPAGFEAPWRKSTGLRDFGFAFSGPGNDVAEITRDQLMARMREASGLDVGETGGAAT